MKGEIWNILWNKASSFLINVVKSLPWTAASGETRCFWKVSELWGERTNRAGGKPEMVKWREKRDKMEPTQSKLRICAGKVTFSGRPVPVLEKRDGESGPGKQRDREWPHWVCRPVKQKKERINRDPRGPTLLSRDSLHRSHVLWPV